jgi:hypothetical protein
MSQAIRASQEQDLLRAMSQGIRASQEQDLLNCAMQRSLEDRGNRMPAKSSQAKERDMVNRAVQRSLSHAHSAPEPLAPPVAPPAPNPTLTRGSEDKELDAAIQRSISLARKVEPISASSAERESDDDAMLRRAMEASILQAQLEEAATRARAEEELERALEASKATIVSPVTKLHADLPTPLLEAPPLTYSQDANSVRTLEDEIVRTNGYTAVAPTAAAARSPRGISTSKPVRTSESVSANYAAQIGLGIYV